MNFKMQLGSGMRKVMQLMQSGDLKAATAAIQRGLGGDVQPTPANEAEKPIEGKGQFIAGAYAGENGARRYHLYIPEGHQGKSRPLVVMLHGCTQTPIDFATGTRMNEVAEERGCFVLYPEQPRSANQQLCWNWFNTADQRRDAGEPGILAGMVGEITGKYGIDRSRVYVAGLSAGGAMAVILGRTHPEIFAAVGVHSGLPFGVAHDVPSALAAMKSGPAAVPQHDDAMATIVFHGDRDATVNPANGEQVARQAAGACNCDVTQEDTDTQAGARTFSRKLFKDGDGKVFVESWLIHGGAHKWSGGDPRGTHTDAAGPDASREMMRFFLERRRDSQPAA